MNKNSYLFAINCLLRSLQKFVDNLFGFKGDETESFPLILCLIEGHFNFDDLYKI